MEKKCRSVADSLQALPRFKRRGEDAKSRTIAIDFGLQVLLLDSGRNFDQGHDLIDEVCIRDCLFGIGKPPRNSGFVRAPAEVRRSPAGRQSLPYGRCDQSR